VKNAAADRLGVAVELRERERERERERIGSCGGEE